MNKSDILIIVLLLLLTNAGHSENKNWEWVWNQTDRSMPAFVHDSIQHYFKSYKEERTLFTLHGKGINADIVDIDGTYILRRFTSHSYNHLLLIYHSDVYIVKSLNYGGVVAELCRFASQKQMEDSFFRKMCLGCFQYLLYSYWDETGEDKLEIVRTQLNNRKKDYITGVYKELTSKHNIENELPFYILTKDLDENETIMLLGLLGGFGFDDCE